MVLDSGVPFVHVPCKNVAEHVKTSVPELEAMLENSGDIGAYLLQIFREYVGTDIPRSKEIWDLAAVAWLVEPRDLPSKVMPTPRLRVDEQLSWELDPERPPYRVLTDAKRDQVFATFLATLRTYLQSS